MSDQTATTIGRERIAELLAPFVGADPLADFQISAIKNYIDLLLKWNAKLNLTSIRDPEKIVTRHFGESLFAAKQLFPAGDSRESAIDIGSGAGFPGIALKLWAPHLELTLIESHQRKATFLREAIRAIDLTSIAVLSQRAESVSLQVDLVTFRAVEHFERILPVALRLVRPGGRIALMIGEGQIQVAHAALETVLWHRPLSIPQSRNEMVMIGEQPS